MELESEGVEGSNCHQLDNLERMVYEVAFSGDAEQLYHVLRVGGLCPCSLAAHPRPVQSSCWAVPLLQAPHPVPAAHPLSEYPALMRCTATVLQTQSNMAKRSAQGSPEASSKQEVLDNLKAKALTMFEQIDLDGNGVIDRWALGAHS